MPDKNLAQRRHDEARVKHNRAKRLTFEANARQIGRHAQTPAACSCWMCGNPRKYFGERTVQERRFLQDSQEYLNSPCEASEG